MVLLDRLTRHSWSDLGVSPHEAFQRQLGELDKRHPDPRQDRRQALIYGDLVGNGSCDTFSSTHDRAAQIRPACRHSHQSLSNAMGEAYLRRQNLDDLDLRLGKLRTQRQRERMQRSFGSRIVRHVRIRQNTERGGDGNNERRSAFILERRRGSLVRVYRVSDVHTHAELKEMRQEQYNQLEDRQIVRRHLVLEL